MRERWELERQAYWWLLKPELRLSGDFAGGSEVKGSACNAGDLGSIPEFDPWVGKIPWRRKWQPTPIFLSGESHGRRNLVGYSPWGSKGSDTTERLHFHFQGYLEECVDIKRRGPVQHPRASQCLEVKFWRTAKKFQKEQLWERGGRVGMEEQMRHRTAPFKKSLWQNAAGSQVNY